MVFKNPAVRTIDVAELFSNQYVGNYIPFTMLLHSLTWLLFGTHAGMHHLPAILFHLLNGFLVFRLGQRLFANRQLSQLATLIFLLHPLQIESVGWIAELKTVLAGTFCLAGLLTYINYIDRKSSRAYFFTLLFFVAGCLSKPSAVA